MRSLLFLALVAISTGCSFRVSGTAPSDGGADDAPEDGAPNDGPRDAPPSSACMAKWRDGTVQLTAPTQLLQLGSPTDTERDPFISTDDLTLYFASSRTGSAGGSDVYAATRASTSAAFGAPAKVADLSSANYDTRVTLSGDGLIAVRSSDPAGTPDLALANRATTTGTFGAFSATPFASVNDATPQYDPELSASGLHVYYAQGSPQRIVMVSRTSTSDPFANPVDIMNTNDSNADPALSDDELILVFASNRTGVGDVYFASRASATDPFGTPVIVPTINDNGTSDGDPALSTDGCTLYFASNRGTGGDWELYAARVML